MKLCQKCNGTGRYLGIGFITIDCKVCDDGCAENDAPELDKIDRKSKSYQEAIKDIMAINPKITRKEAVKMFDEAYAKD